MNDKELGELRRRIRTGKNNMTAICGCYVNDKKEIISRFRLPLGIMPENESEKYFALLRRTLSGGLNRSLIDICFQTKQVMEGPEHTFLMQLRQSSLKDEELLEQLYQKILSSVTLEGSFAILVTTETYDVPFKSKDGTASDSQESYCYLLCAVCPVKQTKGTLQYDPQEKAFHDGGIFQTLSAPELGFLFPAFDNRATNIYNALYYCRNLLDSQEPLVESLFAARVPKPAKEQKRTFETLLSSALEEDCDMDLVQTVHQELRSRMEAHKEARIPEPLLIGKEDVRQVLEEYGVEEKHLAKFSVDFDSEFGYESQLAPGNLIDQKTYEVKTPDVVIKVAPDRTDLVETRIIGGVKYILIQADEDVEVNGVSIHIGEKEKATV